jgi:hypothetical protein
VRLEEVKVSEFVVVVASFSIILFFLALAGYTGHGRRGKQRPSKGVGGGFVFFHVWLLYLFIFRFY